MGRRSINTTKSGKYMNPTDQARKEARKQELKKNKKQRQMVRAAVLKGKDPQQILEEMEKIDQMEFNVNQPSPLNEKVLKDKRKKLRDTLERVLSMYYKDDPEKWADLKRKQADYEHKRNQLMAFYESVKSAQQVTVDEIPLPQLPQQITASVPSQIPLPIERKAEHTIYSIATALKLQALGQPIKEPPGCPPGPPPDVNSDGEVEDYLAEAHDGREREQTEEVQSSVQDDSAAAVKPTSLQQKMVALSGQNVDDFMKEMETAQQKKLEGDGAMLEEDGAKPKGSEPPPVPPGTSDLAPQQHTAVVPPPPPLVYPLRLPPSAPSSRPLLPPGPPPGLPPPRLPPPPPPRMIRLPGPPPGMPVLTAAPQLVGTAAARLGEVQRRGGAATITAKPQIRNPSADVTRFVPSALRVKREDGRRPRQQSARALANELKQREMGRMSTGQVAAAGPTKDDAYMQFMKEMQGLL